jgi:hypothetical protein
MYVPKSIKEIDNAQIYAQIKKLRYMPKSIKERDN